ncbi:peroxide stress protein YaaA [uncultured Subdoligranulum sp.]|uniref:peroxide stress protein YaaA n=1 Tax=uncultured Subdoligranulum sp. TaxID=512298 RepID=UPI002614568A|nr:peroxide stress protein YaaA [uncultured Subdoligranulum sp.]
MKIIISPAKKMNTDPDSLPWQELPQFLEKTEQLYLVMRSMPCEALQKVWKCNDALAKLNVERLQTMNLRKNLTPAILSYEGIQYRYMAPSVFSEEQLSYVQTHLRILSGFYGLLRPFDGVTPYRLEMQAKLVAAGAKDVYSFWGDTLATALCQETDCIVNLASKEYSVCITRYLPETVRFITCVFGEEKNGKIVEKATMCKMARGEMVRFMAEKGVEKPEEIQQFDRLHFQFCPERSDATTYVFVRHAD